MRHIISGYLVFNNTYGVNMWTIAALILTTLIPGIEARVPYIVGGEVATKGRWPWQVSLMFDPPGGHGFQHWCGASILNEHWILTAAHCIMRSQALNDYKVYLGMSQLSISDYEQELPIADIILHPKWNLLEPGIPNDMCLLRVDGTINLANQFISAIPLARPSESYAGNPDCWITGWGRANADTNAASDYLREGNVLVLTNDVCVRKFDVYGKVTTLSIEHVCAGDPDVQDIYACKGDSGGPLVCRRNGAYELVGVASRSGTPDCSHLPSVYMRVSTFRDWITSTIAP